MSVVAGAVAVNVGGVLVDDDVAETLHVVFVVAFGAVALDIGSVVVEDDVVDQVEHGISGPLGHQVAVIIHGGGLPGIGRRCGGVVPGPGLPGGYVGGCRRLLGMQAERQQEQQ